MYAQIVWTLLGLMALALVYALTMSYFDRRAIAAYLAREKARRDRRRKLKPARVNPLHHRS